MFKLTATNRDWIIDKPQIMAIMNATPDSFFTGSRHSNMDVAIETAASFIENGADIIDVGGQSTRPGAPIVHAQEEIERVIPLISAISKAFPNVLISVDTFRSEVADAAIATGAHIVNDISCGQFEPSILEVVARNKAAYIGMHITGDIESMHIRPESRVSVMNEVLAFFKLKMDLLAAAGIQEWVIDPGFGFGKTTAENFELVKSLSLLTTLQLPILLGVSRKSSIYKTLGISPEEALNGTSVVHTIGIQNGAHILRVHDVKEAREVIQLMEYLH